MISLVNKYLEISRFTDRKEAFKDLFQSHPNYPSLFAISHTLDILVIEHVAIKVHKEKLFELPDFFLATFNEDLVLVSKTEEVVSIVNEKGEKRNLSYNKFAEDWSGVIIAIEPNEHTLNNNLKGKLKELRYSVPIFSLIAMSVFYKSYSIIDFVLLLTSILGLFFSILILQEKFSLSNQIVSKFCNISPDTSCKSVIKSERGQINKWLDFSDLPVLFFSVNTLSLLLQPAGISNFIVVLSLFSLPVIVYSIWLQKFQLKKWCLLCLVISFIVVFQSVAWYFKEQLFLNIKSSDLFYYLFSMIVIASLWLAIKPYIENKIKIDKSINELKKFKRNYEVFNFLLKEIRFFKGFDQLESLQFGNRNSTINLTLILNPSCGQCHKAFQEAYELVSKYSQKIFLNVLFNINPENNDSPYKVVVESLLAINNSDPVKMERAISDWYIQEMELEAWKDKWEVCTVSTKVKHLMRQQYNWCLENEFNYSPIKLLNDKVFPNEYDINELKYFLNDLLEATEVRRE